jgi:hypothetical protein
MAQADTPKSVGRPARLLAALACAFLLGGGLGFALGRWGPLPNGELTQGGELGPLAIGAEFEVRYPHPYESLPCLAVEETLIAYEVLYRNSAGFRIRVKNFYANAHSARYTAKGIPQRF